MLKWEHSWLFPINPVHQAFSDTASDKMKRLKGINNYCVDKQVATEDNNFPSELGHMAEAIIRNKWNKTGY